MTFMKKGEKALKSKPNIEELITYIAKGNPFGVRKLAYKYGYPNFNTYQGSLNFITTFLKEEGEKGFDDLIMHHPDRDLILEVYHSRYPIGINFSSYMEEENFSKEEEKNSLLNSLGLLIAKRKERIVALIEKSGMQVRDREDFKEISDKIVYLLQAGNKEFQKGLSEEIALLTDNPYEEFAGVIAQGVGKVADIFSSGIKRKNDRENNSAAITMAALNYKLGKKKESEEKPEKSNKILFIGLGIGGGFLLLTIILILLLNKKS